MIQPDNPAMPTFEIDSLNSPFFQILQPQAGSDRWLEVGFVWTIGASRTDCTEHWYLYSAAPAGSSFAAYQWPGYDASGRQSGASLRLVPAARPTVTDPAAMPALLQRRGVTVFYVKAATSPG